jgi:hypothetical protein
MADLHNSSALAVTVDHRVQLIVSYDKSGDFSLDSPMPHRLALYLLIVHAPRHTAVITANLKSRIGVCSLLDDAPPSTPTMTERIEDLSAPA